VSGYLKLSWTT